MTDDHMGPWNKSETDDHPTGRITAVGRDKYGNGVLIRFGEKEVRIPISEATARRLGRHLYDQVRLIIEPIED